VAQDLSVFIYDALTANTVINHGPQVDEYDECEKVHFRHSGRAMGMKSCRLRSLDLLLETNDVAG
jgi:hypothetical protein